jgi:uncharacterized protein with PIN domain/sulfur carrier protein ThiS
VGSSGISSLKTAHFRFYAELNDFLPAAQRFEDIPHPFLNTVTVKDRIESFGVPHTEVDLILVNGEPVDFTYRLEDGDRVSVFPVFEAFDIAGVSRLRPEPLRDPRFVLDTHLGKLAAYLRMVGFDTLYRNCYTDDELAAVSRDQRRILLTRDVGLLKRGAVTHGCFVRNTDARRQLAEIVARFHLVSRMRPFTRCLRCNGVLEDVAPDAVRDRIPPRAAELYHDFRRCPECGRVYWQGGHYQRMRQRVEALAVPGA